MGTNAHAIQQLIQGGTSTTKYTSSKLSASNKSLRNPPNNVSLTQKRMSAGNINLPSRSMHLSNSLNSRQNNVGTSGSQGKIKVGSKKINQSSSMNPTDRENTHKVQAFLDETS
jgi:hypothetical protein